MATPELADKMIAAGAEYGDSLVQLGLDPHALFWAFDHVAGQHVLVLVTDFFDLKGPLEISKQLFRAYNSSITPKEIDPFVVRLHSINQPAGVEYSQKAAGDWKIQIFDRDMNVKPGTENATVSAITIAGLEMREEWIIRYRRLQKRTTVDLNRRWRRFSDNIDQIAA